MRWIAASLLIINVLALAGQLVLSRESGQAVVAAPVSLDRDLPSLQLIGELDEKDLQQMLVEKQRLRLAARNRKAGQPLCTLVGPFSELLNAEYFVERLAALDVNSTIRDLEIPGEVSYWVYLPPLGSRKQAFNRLRELQAKGIDSYVIPKGELANGISFGMFSQPDLAASRMDDMRSRGYAAELDEIARSYKETWVVVSPGQADLLSSETWQKMLSDGADLERRQNFCPPVASE